MRTLGMVTSFGMAALLAGCGTGAGNSTFHPQLRFRLHGRVHGGQQPIGGASIQLYSIGTAGNGSASQTLLNQPAITASDGTFNITGVYQCPQQGALTYIVATGGNPGLAAGTNNPAISLMAVTGACNTPNDNGSGGTYYTLDPNLFVSINEVTTVAAVYSLAPFILDYADIGSASTLGIATSFTNATMLADIGAGVSPGSGLPVSVTYDPAIGFPVVVNTLANMISSCINTDGTGTPCAGLFAGATPPSGIAPANTIAALLDIAANPGRNVSALFNLVQPAPHSSQR